VVQGFTDDLEITMLHCRLAALHRARPVAIGALGAVALTAIAACGPKSVLAPPPPPPSCSPVTGQSGVGATLSPAAAAEAAASAVREARTDAADEHSLVTVESSPTGPTVTTHPVSSPTDAASVAAEAAIGNDLLAVDTDAPVSVAAATNDPNSGSQWAFTNTSFGALWPTAIGTSSPTLSVAVIDTGVDATHPDLSGQVLTGVSLVSGAPTAADDNGHGTHVAGIIAAATDNGVGVRGAAPGVKILPIKALNNSGSGSYSTVANAMYTAVSQGAKVINMSLGGTVASAIFDGAVAYANQHGVVVVAAAGNDGTRGNPASYPGSTPGVIAVGAVDSALNRASFSTCGAYVDITAPGAAILSTIVGGGYGTMSGTSMASPYAAAGAAVLKAAHPACTPAAIETALKAGATDRGAAGRDDFYGAGVVDPQRSLTLLPC
jgi:serine protease